MAKDIFVVGGSKGGVGKSLVAMALIDFLQEREEKVLLVESDTSNPDVWKAYGKTVPAVTVDLDNADGWIGFVNACDVHADHAVVVNTAARNHPGVSAYSGTLRSCLGDLQRRLVTLWVINRQRDSMELLKRYMAALPDSLVHVVRNAYWGKLEKFELYNESELRKAVEGGGGKSLLFPDLADRVVDELYSNRLSVHAALEGEKRLPLGNRAELGRWKQEAGRMFEEVISG